MAKMKVGILVDSYCLPTAGGGYSYYRTLLHAMNEYQWHADIEIVNILFTAKADRQLLQKPGLLISKKYIYSATYLFNKVLYTIAYRLDKARYKETLLKAAGRIARLRDRNTEKELRRNKIDLVYYLKPEETSLDYPFITTHWDVGHRSMAAFPETTLDGQYEIREHYYSYVLNKAFLILCESEKGAQELLRYYAINRTKVQVMPLFSGDVARMTVAPARQQEILEQHGLVQYQFFVYPAQFWAHKNHYNLLIAFRDLSREPGNQGLKLMLCGSDKGNLAYIRQVVAENGIEDKVLMPGFVPDETLHVFYRNALALVMPTFLGPTNIPLLEAAELDCPVLCSDLEGHREMMGEAALYVDPADARDIAAGMQKIQKDPALRRNLISEGRRQVAASGFSIGKSLQVLEQILLRSVPVRKTWGFAYCLLPFLVYGLLPASVALSGSSATL